jgi:hypothetical protein
VSAPRADPELSNVDCSDARFSFRWISLAGAVLHVIRDGTPMVVSRLGCITAAELATAGRSRNGMRGRK